MTEWLHFYFLWSRESAIATGTHYPTNLAQISSDLYPSLHRTFQIDASFPGFIINSRLPMQETRVWSLGQEDPLEGGHSNPIQYPCLENPMDRGAWQATVQGVTKSRTRLSDFTFTFPSCCHSPLNYMAALRVGVMPWKEFQHATHSSHPYHITGFGLEPSSYLFLIVDITREIPLSSASQPSAW